MCYLDSPAARDSLSTCTKRIHVVEKRQRALRRVDQIKHINTAANGGM